MSFSQISKLSSSSLWIKNFMRYGFNLKITVFYCMYFMLCWTLFTSILKQLRRNSFNSIFNSLIIWYTYIRVYSNIIILSKILYWTLDVSRTVFYEIILVRLPVRLSVCSSVTNFSQDWLISFFWYSIWW